MENILSLETRAKTFEQTYEVEFKEAWEKAFQTKDRLYRQKKRRVKWYGSCNNACNELTIDSKIHLLILIGAEWCLHYLEVGKMIRPPMYQCERKIEHMPISDQHQFYLESGEYVFLVTLFRYGWETDITVEAMVE